MQHNRLFFDTPIKSTEIEFVLQTKDEAHVARLVAALEAESIVVNVLSNLAHSTLNA